MQEVFTNNLLPSCIVLGPGEVAQLVTHLIYNHEVLSSVPSTHIGKKKTA